MCLAVPGQVISIDDSTPPENRMARVSFAGLVKEVCIAAVPEVVVGDYVIVHVGFALQRLEETEAQEVLTYLRELGEIEASLASPVGGAR